MQARSSNATERAGRPAWARVARVLGVLLTVALVLRLSGWVERLTFYFPSRDGFATPHGVENVLFMTADGVKLHGWFLRSADARPGERKPAVLHCHGNAGNIESHADFSRFLVHRGVHVLVFDYRGYGRSDAARPSREALRVDALGAYDYLAARPDVDPARIGVYGVSLGAVFALAAATERDAAAVCTVSAFSTWARVANDHAPVLGWLLMRRGLDPATLVKRLGERALLVVHGGRDTIVQARHAERIVEAARGAGVTVERVIVPEADHNDIADFEASRGAIGGFFERTLGSRP